MTKNKKIIRLVEYSYTKGKLDPEKIAIISKKLVGKELVAYVDVLQKKREEEKVYITTAIDAPQSFQASMKKLFPQKDIFFTKDATILGGIIVKMLDFVYDASLRKYVYDIKKAYKTADITN